MKINYSILQSLVGMIVFVTFFGSSMYAQTHITNPTDLVNIQDNLAGSYILDNDINMQGIAWQPKIFTGTFDGNGHVIHNLTVNRPNDHTGSLFLYITNATIKNLGLENVDVTGNWTGGIAGISQNSTIEKCFVNGKITGVIVGGIVGMVENTKISQSYSMATVTGPNQIGGIAGYLTTGSSVENCYTNSTVIATAHFAGGIAGWAQDINTQVINCIAKGTVKSQGNFTGGIIGVVSGSAPILINNCLANLTSITVVNSTIPTACRIIAAENSASFPNNYGLASTILSDPSRTVWISLKSGKDGEDVSSNDVLGLDLYTVKMNYDFQNTWVMTTAGTKLKWENVTTTIGIVNQSKTKEKVFSLDGQICVSDTELGSQIQIYNTTGALLEDRISNATIEKFKIKGISIVFVKSNGKQNAFKVINF